MKQTELEQQTEEPIYRLIKGILLSDPDLKQLIKDVAREEIKAGNIKSEPKQTLTCKQLAKMWQKCTKTVYDMTDEELRKLGYIRKKIGVNVRFEKIGPEKEG